VEKLQTISTKYRKQQETGQFPANFLRHYYDVYCLLDQTDVQAFIGTDAYRTHKDRRFPKLDNRDISSNPAFSLSDPDTFGLYERAYERTAPLYYHGRSTLKELLARIASNAERLSRSGRIPAALYKRLFHSWWRMDPAATGPAPERRSTSCRPNSRSVNQ